MTYRGGFSVVQLWSLLAVVAAVFASSFGSNQAPLGTDRRKRSGCGISHAHNGTSQKFTLFSPQGGGIREYLLHLPSNYKPEVQTALIISFHGFTQHMHQHEAITMLSNETVNPQMITVYPQGLGQPPAWQGAPYAGKVSDLAFTTDLLNHLKQIYCIDTTRVYATGMSNGGGFVNILACSRHGSNFAAFAPVAGAFYNDVEDDSGSFSCWASRSQRPIFEIHGQNDSIIAYEGGAASGVMIPAIPDWLRRWARRNGCSSSALNTTQELVGGHVLKVSYDCNGSRDIVSGLMVRGMDHCWPNTRPNKDNRHVGTWIDAAPYILDFFETYPRAA